MSLASVFASAVAQADTEVPASFSGPGGLLTASVDSNGNCVLSVGGRNFTAPPGAVIAFSNWVTATFV